MCSMYSTIMLGKLTMIYHRIMRKALSNGKSLYSKAHTNKMHNANKNMWNFDNNRPGGPINRPKTTEPETIDPYGLALNGRRFRGASPMFFP